MVGEGDLMEDPMWVSMMVWTTWLLIAIIIDGVMVPLKMYFSRKSMRQVGKIIPEKELPPVTVVVPAHNEEDHIESCLLSIIQNEYPDKKMEIIVVDDGSKDNTINLVKKIEVDAIMHGVDLKLIKKGHTGKVHTLNTGIRSSNGEIIITIDADIRLDEYAVKNVVQAFVEDETVGAATGYIEIEWDETR
ncbi:MAG: glycosyltransferase, partial [Methanobacterium sp.]|nr:glycosyltransferase [Methanobacterium sp.]